MELNSKVISSNFQLDYCTEDEKDLLAALTEPSIVLLERICTELNDALQLKYNKDYNCNQGYLPSNMQHGYK